MATTEASYFGSLPGDFSVDSNGGAVYSIPLQLPPGTADMMPALSLVYNSGGGNGILGMGWSLQGLSSITRVEATVAQDGFFGAVSYGGNDRFALDGQRLVPLSGASYQDPSATYHTEIESWQKVVPVYHNTPGRYGPDSFLVYTKDGKCLEYGTSSDAQVPASATNPSIRVWALNKITDLNGNYLTVTYQQDTASNNFYPSRIDYTGNSAGGLAPQRSVQFTYTSRPGGADSVPHYLGGYVVEGTQLLQSIRTFLDGQLIMTYTFTPYPQPGAATGRTRLYSITQTDATGAALPPTIFTYQDGDSNIFSVCPPPTNIPKINLLPMDVNGDGLVDLVAIASSGLVPYLQPTIFLSDGTGFSSGIPISTEVPYDSNTQLLPMDIDGNGCMDLVCANHSGVSLGLTVLHSQPDGTGGWEFSVAGEINGAGPSSIPSGGQLIPMDVDGDGRTDLVYAYPNPQTPWHLDLMILFSNGDMFAPSATDQTSIPILGFDPQAQYLALDYNGDGMTDLLYVSGGALHPFLSQGRNGLSPQTPIPFPNPTVPVGATLQPIALTALDVNGDGLGDIVQVFQQVTTSYGREEQETYSLVIQTTLSNGVSFESPVTQTFTSNLTTLPNLGVASVILPAEVNGDGLPDLVVMTPSGSVPSAVSSVNLSVLLSTGAGFSPPVTAVTQPSANGARLPWGFTMLPMDYNGDGKTDLVYAYTQPNSGDGGVIAPIPVAGPFPDLLSTITNGLGGKISITYKPLTDPTVYSKGTSTSQLIETPGLTNNGISGATYSLSHTADQSSPPGSTYATRTVDFPTYVVASYSKNDGRGSQYQYSSTYIGAKLDLTGRGWLGFESIQVTDPQVQTTTLSTYNQLFPQTGTVSDSLIRSISQATDGDWMKQTTFTYSSVQTVTNGQYWGAYQVLPQMVQSDFYTFAPPPADPTNQSTPDATHQKIYQQYDAYGNPTLTIDVGDSTLYTWANYDNDPTQWRLGYLAEQKATSDSAGTEVLTWEKLDYYPDTQNLKTHSVWNDQQNQWLVTQYDYDAYGNCKTVTDPSLAPTTTLYDTTYQTFVAQTTSPPNQAGTALVTTTNYYPQFGVQKSVTDPNGVTMQQNVDGLGRIITTLGPNLSNTLTPLTQRTWGTDAKGIYEEVQTLLDWSGDTWGWTRSYLDGLGRVYHREALGPDGSTTVAVDRQFDSKNNVVQETLPYFIGDTPVTINYIFDNYGRLITTVQPANEGGTTTTTINYVSTNTVVQTQTAGTPEARPTTFTYGMFNGKRLVTQRVDATSGVKPSYYYYDALGRLTRVVDQIGVTNSVTYDSLNRRLVVASQVNGKVLSTESFAYNDVTRQVTHVDAMNIPIVLNHDALGRLREKTVASLPPTTYVYDTPGQANALGRLGSVIAPDGVVYAYTYDAYGNQSGITLALGGSSYGFQKTHTPTRQIQQLGYPDGAVLTNHYNPGGQLATVTLAELGSSSTPTTYATFSQFLASGRPQTVNYGNTLQENVTYTVPGQLQSQVLTAPNSVALLKATYQWNNLNTLDAITDQIGSAKSQSFIYDAVGRLKTATGDYPPQQFAYDDGGNLILKDGITYTYNGYQITTGTLNNEQVLAAEYDADGSMKTVTKHSVTTTFNYDDERQLIQTGNATFTYDYTGRRLTKQVANGPTTYYVAPYYEVTVLPGGGGTQHTKYVPGTDGLIASITTVESGTGNSADNPSPGIPVPGTFYFHTNQINNTTLQTDARGNLLATVEYLPYGEVFALTGPDAFRQKFTGKERDTETGLYYFRSRYYDPQIGRFLTADSRLGGPLQVPDVFNRYAYALNSPVNYVDPTGHSVFSDIGHFFGHDVGHWFSHDVKGFFTHDVKSFFTNRIVENVISFFVDAGLVVGGIAVIATTPLTGPGSTAIGSVLLGAGIGGLTYNISTLAGHKRFNWGKYWANVGIGGMTGLISGGIAAGAGAIVTAAAENMATFAVGGLGRIGLNVAAGVVGNAGAGTLGELAGNSLNHLPLKAGLGGAALIGGILGGIAAGASEFAAFRLSNRVPAQEEGTQLQDYSEPEDREREPLLRQNAMPARNVLATTVKANFWVGLPGVVFTGLDALSMATGLHPKW